MLTPTKTNATYQDVLDAPAGVRAELIDGALYLQARPRGSHQLALANLRAALTSQPESAREWVLLPEIELHIPYTLSPDIAGWRRGRFTEPIDSAYFSVVPDWVCEVLSPGTQSYDRGLKARKYLDRGVQYLWLVDPAECSLEVMEAHGGAWMLINVFAGTDEFCAPPFGGAWIDLGRLWRP